MPPRTALLDTSAFKALSRDSLLAAMENGWHLTTSPWCFFELLCHLDEEPDFAKARGHLMKFRGLEIVDKPLDRAVATSQQSNDARIWSSDLAYAALGAIDAAGSLDDLNRSLIVDEAGNKRDVKGCVDRIRQRLEEEESRFRQVIAEVIKLIRSGQVPRSTAEERHHAILDMVASGGSALADTPDLDYGASATNEEILRYSYAYWAYAFLRAVAQADAGGSTCGKNDFEDGQLCAYVPLDEPMWVIADDRPLLSTLSATREILVDVGMAERAAFKPAKPDMLLQGGPS